LLGAYLQAQVLHLLKQMPRFRDSLIGCSEPQLLLVLNAFAKMQHRL
jgi:hypothetical protein